MRSINNALRHALARVVRALALLSVLAYFAFGILSEGSDDDGKQVREPENVTTVDIRPRRISPGGAILVDLRKQIRKSDREQVRLHLGDRELLPVSSVGKTLFFDVPDDLAQGPMLAEVQHEDHTIGQAALDVRDVSPRRLLRNGLGGVALLLFGIWLLARSFGKLGLTLVHSSARWLAGSNLRCVVAGFAAGIVAFSPRAVARFFGDILSLQLVPAASGLLMVTGAFLGTWFMGALLPFFSTSDGLLLVPAGGLALFVARSGRDRWIALAIIGTGLMLFGLNLLRSGLSELPVPLALAELVARLNAASVTGVVLSFIVGIALGLLLQAPGAVFAVVAGVVQSSGFLGHDTALAVLAGGISGTALTAVWSSEALGPRAQRAMLAVAGLLSLTALVHLVLTPILSPLIGPEASASLSTWAPGRKVLFPGAQSPLVIDFVISLVVSTTVVAGAAWVGWRAIGAERRQTWGDRLRSRDTHVELGRKFGLDLSAALRRSHGLILGLERRIFATTNSPSPSLRQELDELEALITEFLPGQQPNAQTQLPELYGVGLVLSQLHATLEQAIGFAESLRESKVSDLAAQQVHDLVQAVQTSLQDLGESLAGGEEIDLERAQQVEIAINRGEANLRQALCSKEIAGRASAPSLGLLSSFAGTLENVGNEVYRLAVVLDRAGLPAGLRQ